VPIPSQQDVRAVLEAFHAQHLGIVRGAWDDWLNSGHGGSWTKRGRANYVWEQIATRAKADFHGHPLVRMIDGQDTIKFLVADIVLFRFKKGDGSGMSSNYPTQTSMAFHDHDQNLFGLPDIMRVDIVYTLSRLETAIEDVLVVCRDGDEICWTYSLLGAAPNVLELPFTPPSQADTPARQLVRRRNPGEERKRDAED
jgi:hypothetical protein